METEIKWKSMIKSLVELFGENQNDYTIKHFKCEEKLTHTGSTDQIQITIVIEIEKKNENLL